MKHLWSAALFAAWGIAPTAYAEDTDADCTAFAEAALVLLEDFGYSAEPFEARFDPDQGYNGFCVIKDLTLVSGRGWDMTDFYIERIHWGSDEWERLQNGLPPRSLGIGLFGVRPYLGSALETPIVSYTSRVQAMARSGSYLYLDYDWSAEEKRFQNFEISYGIVGETDRDVLNISADIRGVDLTDWRAIQLSLGSARLHALEIDLVMDGLFETLVLPYVGPVLLENSSPPEAQVEALKRTGVEFATALPTTIFGAQGGAELAELIESIPHPRGDLALQFTSKAGLGTAPFVSFVFLGEMQFWSILESSGSEVMIDWEPFDE